MANAPFAQTLGLTIEASYRLSHLSSSLLRPIGVRMEYRLTGWDTSSVETLQHARRERIPLPGIGHHRLSSAIDYSTELWGVTITGDYASDRCVSVGESALDDQSAPVAGEVAPLVCTQDYRLLSRTEDPYLGPLLHEDVLIEARH